MPWRNKGRLNMTDRSKNKRRAFRTGKLSLLLLIIALSCTFRAYDTNRLLSDYRTEGFLDPDHYQVIVEGLPDPKARGLVEKRESALKDAKARMDEVVLERLANYCLTHQARQSNIRDMADVVNLAEAKKGMKEELNKFLRYGTIAFEYYNEDHTAVLVYRITRDNLIGDLESVKTAFLTKMEAKK